MQDGAKRSAEQQTFAGRRRLVVLGVLLPALLLGGLVVRKSLRYHSAVRLLEDYIGEMSPSQVEWISTGMLMDILQNQAFADCARARAIEEVARRGSLELLSAAGRDMLRDSSVPRVIRGDLAHAMAVGAEPDAWRIFEDVLASGKPELHIPILERLHKHPESRDNAKLLATVIKLWAGSEDVQMRLALIQSVRAFAGIGPVEGILDEALQGNAQDVTQRLITVSAIQVIIKADRLAGIALCSRIVADRHYASLHSWIWRALKDRLQDGDLRLPEVARVVALSMEDARGDDARFARQVIGLALRVDVQDASIEELVALAGSQVPTKASERIARYVRSELEKGAALTVPPASVWSDPSRLE